MGSIELHCALNTHTIIMKQCLMVAFALLVLFGQADCQAFTEAQIESLAFIRLNPCERAIWSCCQSDRPTFGTPTFCFERNGCFGLQWLGQGACSSRLINSIGITLQSTKKQIRQRSTNLGPGFIPISAVNRPKK